MVKTEDWGKAIAIHEVAPNVIFLFSPLLSEPLLLWFSWRNILGLLGLAALFFKLAFAQFERALFLDNIVFFSIGISASMGIYTMLPLFLVFERWRTPGQGPTI